MNTRMTLIGTIVVGAALLAPVAQAQRPDDRPGLRGPGAVTAQQDAATSHPDNLAEARGPGAVAAVRLSVPPDAFERAVATATAVPSTGSTVAARPDDRGNARGPGALAPTVVVTSTSNGFDWGDALIGAAGGLGVALLLTGCLVLLQGQRSRARMA